MSRSKNSLDRRRFIKTTCAACIASWAALTVGCKSRTESEETSSTEKESEPMAKMIAKCGIICTGCEAYIATQKDDQAEKVRVAEKWTKMFGAEFTPENITCDGCQSDTGRLSSYAREICEIRKCALTRKVDNCAHCEDYPCEALTKFFEMAPEAKTSLEEVRKRI